MMQLTVAESAIDHRVPWLRASPHFAPQPTPELRLLWGGLGIKMLFLGVDFLRGNSFFVSSRLSLSNLNRPENSVLVVIIRQYNLAQTTQTAALVP
jgi:hypothetical protein